MKRLFRRFHADEAGAVTVDWVVLTAAMVGLGASVVAGIETSVTDLSTGIGTKIATDGTAALAQ